MVTITKLLAVAFVLPRQGAIRIHSISFVPLIQLKASAYRWLKATQLLVLQGVHAKCSDLFRLQARSHCHNQRFSQILSVVPVIAKMHRPATPVSFLLPKLKALLSLLTIPTRLVIQFRKVV
jgi:hypothetical protein